MHSTIRPHVSGLRAAAFVLLAGVVAACSSPAPSQSAAPAAAPAAQAPAESAGPTLTLLEPAEGSFSGHVSTFRWSAVDGADGYKIKVTTLSGRVVWESDKLAEPHAELPNTVALEPEGHTWQVTALKGDAVLATSAMGRFTVTP